MSDVWTPPRAKLEEPGLAANPEAARIRREHISHEASVKSVGLLYYLSAVVLVVTGIISLFAAFSDSEPSPFPSLIVAAFAFGVGALYFWIAGGLRALKRQARVPAGILAGLGLIGFPIGTLINGYILYLLFSKKGTMIFSDEYQQIVADTPDIKYRTSIIVWIFLGLLLALMTLALVTAVLHH